MRRLAAVLLIAGSLLGPGAAVAAAACPQTSVADIEDEVMCPVCGTSLALAIEAPQARRERAFIFDQVEQCRSKDEIKLALVREFGPSVLAVPEDEGFARAAYLVPVLGLVAAMLAVTLATLRWRRRRPGDDEPASQTEPSSAAAERLTADLRRYDL